MYKCIHMCTYRQRTGCLSLRCRHQQCPVSAMIRCYSASSWACGYIYIYIYICTCMYMNIYTCTYIQFVAAQQVRGPEIIYIYIYIYTHTYIYIYIYTCIHTLSAVSAMIRCCSASSWACGILLYVYVFYIRTTYIYTLYV
jgi:hypothetical protein